VLNLEELDAENQMRRAAALLGGLFETGRDHWYVMPDEADEDGELEDVEAPG